MQIQARSKHPIIKNYEDIWISADDIGGVVDDFFGYRIAQEFIKAAKTARLA